jgi:hypothetical protein
MKRCILLACLLLLPLPAISAEAWFIAPFVRVTPPASLAAIPMRGCGMRQFAGQIKADGGKWGYVEVLGNKCLIKISASAGLLTTIAGTYQRIPASRLDDPLSSLSTAQRNGLRQIILDAGYTTAEVNARFPNLANNTLGDALRFLASRRLKPRYDQATDTIILDGPIQIPESVDNLSAVIQ